MSRIILGLLVIAAIYYLFLYNHGAAFMSIADRLTDMFIERLREDRQL